jgi:hypothetical protein
MELVFGKDAVSADGHHAGNLEFGSDIIQFVRRVSNIQDL